MIAHPTIRSRIPRCPHPLGLYHYSKYRGDDTEIRMLREVSLAVERAIWRKKWTRVKHRDLREAITDLVAY